MMAEQIVNPTTIREAILDELAKREAEGTVDMVDAILDRLKPFDHHFVQTTSQAYNLHLARHKERLRGVQASDITFTLARLIGSGLHLHTAELKTIGVPPNQNLKGGVIEVRDAKGKAFKISVTEA